MKSKNKKVKSFKHRKVVAGISLALLTAVFFFVALRVYGYYRDKTITEFPDGPTSAQTKQASDMNADNKKTFIESNQGAEDDQNQNTETPINVGIELTAKQEANGSVTVTSKLPGVSSGTCTLTVTNGAKETVKTATIIYQPEFSTCAGFSVAQSELGTGVWTLSLRLSGSSDAGKSITLRVN